jgi:two-component system, NtrC family, response regulator AlgB
MAEAETPRQRVLVVDDERNIRATLAVCLEGYGCSVRTAASADAALEALRAEPFDVAFVDLRLGAADGLELLPRMLAERPGLAVIVITAYATYDSAVRAVKLGATQYLPKPFTPEQIRLALDQAAQSRALERRVASLEDSLREAAPEIELATHSPAMREAIGLALRAARSEAPILLRGASGTGKGVLARLVHEHSPRRQRPFVLVNCPTLSEELLASELFGHVRGAFTGAVRDQPGRVESADGGTLFLDEIGEIAPSLQAKLLRFLQDREFERLGESRTRRADVRIVAATNRDLEADVASGRFREDLLYRLAVVEIAVPPLRVRVDDIAPLADHFLRFFAAQAGRPAARFSPEALAALRAHAWPGNVRELRNAVERAVVLATSDELGPDLLPARVVGRAAPKPAADAPLPTLEQLERRHIERVLAQAASLDEAAKTLGIDASTLYRKRKRLGL